MKRANRSVGWLSFITSFLELKTRRMSEYGQSKTSQRSGLRSRSCLLSCIRRTDTRCTISSVSGKLESSRFDIEIMHGGILSTPLSSAYHNRLRRSVGVSRPAAKARPRVLVSAELVEAAQVDRGVPSCFCFSQRVGTALTALRCSCDV